MRHGLDADVPRLAVHIVGIRIVAHEAGRFVDLVRERRGDEDLGQERIGVERDRRQKVVQLVG